MIVNIRINRADLGAAQRPEGAALGALNSSRQRDCAEALALGAEGGPVSGRTRFPDTGRNRAMQLASEGAGPARVRNHRQAAVVQAAEPLQAPRWWLAHHEGHHRGLDLGPDGNNVKMACQDARTGD